MGFRVIRISSELFEDIFADGRTFPDREGVRVRVTKGLPAGAKIVDLSRDLYFCTNEWALTVFHPDWPDAPPGDALPEMRVEFSMEDTNPRRAWHNEDVYAALMRPPLAFSKEQVDGLTMEQARVLMAVAEPTALTSPEMSPEAATRLCAELERPRNARRMVVLPDGADVRRSVSPVTAPDWSTTAPADVLAAIDVSRKAAMDRGVSLGPDGLTSELRADCVVSADVIAKQVATEIDLRGSDAPVVLTPEQGKAFRALLDPEPPATCATCNGARFVARAVPGRLFAQSLPCPACGPML